MGVGPIVELIFWTDLHRDSPILSGVSMYPVCGSD